MAWWLPVRSDGSRPLGGRVPRGVPGCLLPLVARPWLLSAVGAGSVQLAWLVVVLAAATRAVRFVSRAGSGAGLVRAGRAPARSAPRPAAATNAIPASAHGLGAWPSRAKPASTAN